MDGKEDEWATSYDDKLGRSFADVRAICASTARDNTEPIDDTGWRYRSLMDMPVLSKQAIRRPFAISSPPYDRARFLSRSFYTYTVRGD